MRRATSVLALLLCGVGQGKALDGDAVPYAASSCVESSESQSYWMIDNFVLKVYNWDNGGSTGTFGFQSYYSGTNTTVECLVQDVDLAKLDTGPWSKCNATGTEFRFDLNDISLTMKETWTFPESPGTVYNANSTGLIMLHGCLDTNTDQGVQSDCYLMEMEMSANATMSA